MTACGLGPCRLVSVDSLHQWPLVFGVAVPTSFAQERAVGRTSVALKAETLQWKNLLLRAGDAALREQPRCWCSWLQSSGWKLGLRPLLHRLRPAVALRQRLAQAHAKAQQGQGGR